ncbi:hypothetical protein ACH4OQ_21530 [Streptomyces luteogriseus]|uniref:hypothetical protein n=1 Tax=Streptomyces luteogriseus TaxID=68233 RepID=UPI003787313F
MSNSTADNTMDRRDNPFPASAVARFSPADRAGLNIETPSVVQALSYVDQYLNSPSEVAPQHDGNVIAIVGEYGTGKTHLTIELLHRVKDSVRENVHSFYLDAPADTFLALYRDRFFRQLDRKDVRQRVAEYYADIIAEDLGDSPLTEDVARRLTERQLEPRQVVEEFGLSHSKFQQELQERLGRITEHEDFGTALGLFMRPEFEAAVWEWLAGHPADSVLRERGIRRTIDDDISALEAIGVFAFLYGRQNHRFILIIDEFEKVLSRDARSIKSESSVLAFKKLLEVFGQARCLLILSGLPDFVEVLPADAQQRISCIVRPTALSFADVRDYVRLSLGRDNGDLSPFNEDSIAYLAELAGGNARKVIRLCYHAYAASANTGAALTRAMLREVAREQFEISSPDDVRSEITRVLDINGWEFELNKQLIQDPTTVADYWLPVGQVGSGCAVIITQSVLHEHEAELLVSAGEAMLSSDPAVAAVLVINGYLAESLRDLISAAFSRVMQYSPLRFTDDFSAAVGAFIRRLEETSDEDRMNLVESKLDQLLRQTSGVRKSLEHVQRSTISPLVIENAVDGGLRRVFGALSGDRNLSAVALPYPTEQLFSSALNAAEGYSSSLEQAMRSAFVNLGRRAPSDVPHEVVESFYTAQSVVALIKIFRDSVARLVVSPDFDYDMARGPLEDVCRFFDRNISELTYRLPSGPESITVPLNAPSFGDDNAFDIRRLAERVYESIRRYMMDRL